jgi:hypothetical protein
MIEALCFPNRHFLQEPHSITSQKPAFFKESLDYYEMKQHKPWFDVGCSKFLDEQKQAKFRWLQDPSEINGDNLNSERSEASRHFRNKKGEYLKDKIKELAMNNKNKNIRDMYRRINEFKRSYQHRNNLTKDENGDLADSHYIVNKWKSYFSQLLNIHNISDVIQIKIYTAEAIIPSPSWLEFGIAIAKLKKYKSPGSDQIPEELIQAGSETLVSPIFKLINSIWNKEELPEQCKESIIVPVY